ncbi:MAG TPA: 3-deoxy-D-manno-octulosonic acid transferase [Blastocatellia bacterium]|nr:3-deoxy-D-manno-octulosonic acid transferase [Blastocatellia bacterium]
MYFLYSLALSFLFIALLPYFFYQAARHRKYSGSFKQRMGWLPEAVRGDDGQTIWLHAVSVGEYLAARTLIERLKSELPGFRIVVSTTTRTGQTLARAECHKFAGTFYFPFDWNFSVRRALDWVRPSIVLILETELWPNFLRECRRRGVLTLLVNGRISTRSFRRYRKAPAFIRSVVEDLSLMIMQSEEDAERSRALGAQASRVRVCGNLKYEHAEVGDSGSGVGSQFDGQFGLSASPHLIVAGSTAPGEEEILLACFDGVRSHQGLEDARLLIAPRHPERFDEVARLIARSGFTFARRSETTAAVSKPDVILLDTIGELASLYRYAAVVFVGGSLVRRGGHNIIEPAAFGKPIVVGQHTENFRQVISDFQRANAVVQIDASAGQAQAALSRELIRLLSDGEQAREMGLRARSILIANRGATDCIISAIRQLVSLGS